jgi:hypothetical protein
MFPISSVQYALLHFFNSSPVLQLLEDSVEERMEKALAESDKVEAESKDADTEDNKARNTFIFCDIRIFLHHVFYMSAFLLPTCI